MDIFFLKIHIYVHIFIFESHIFKPKKIIVSDVPNGESGGYLCVVVFSIFLTTKYNIILTYEKTAALNVIGTRATFKIAIFSPNICSRLVTGKKCTSTATLTTQNIPVWYEFWRERVICVSATHYACRRSIYTYKYIYNHAVSTRINMHSLLCIVIILTCAAGGYREKIPLQSFSRFILKCICIYCFFNCVFACCKLFFGSCVNYAE